MFKSFNWSRKIQIYMAYAVSVFISTCYISENILSSIFMIWSQLQLCKWNDATFVKKNPHTFCASKFKFIWLSSIPFSACNHLYLPTDISKLSTVQTQFQWLLMLDYSLATSFINTDKWLRKWLLAHSHFSGQIKYSAIFPKTVVFMS